MAPRARGERVTTVDVPEAERRRFSLTDEDIVALARQALIIEEHYKQPMDIEWGKDGSTGEIYILQARPETVQSRAGRTIQRFTLKSPGRNVLATGRSIGQRIGPGPARVIRDVSEMARVQPGDVLVADMTDPDWEPVMKRAAAIVTNRGGRTCHAAIIARELGIPAVVGCGDATADDPRGPGSHGVLRRRRHGLRLRRPARVRAQADRARLAAADPRQDHDERRQSGPRLRFRRHSQRGVGLARLEFIINRMIGVHPSALLEFDRLDGELQDQIRAQMARLRRPGRVLRRRSSPKASRRSRPRSARSR